MAETAAMPIAEAFAEIVALAERLGVSEINKLPGCWEHQIDDRWWIALNGHKEPIECSHGVKVEPFDCYIEFNGWPAGSICPSGGIIAAGDCANEDRFIEAVKASSDSAPMPEGRGNG